MNNKVKSQLLSCFSSPETLPRENFDVFPVYIFIRIPCEMFALIILVLISLVFSARSNKITIPRRTIPSKKQVNFYFVLKMMPRLKPTSESPGLVAKN